MLKKLGNINKNFRRSSTLNKEEMFYILTFINPENFNKNKYFYITFCKFVYTYCKFYNRLN